MSKTIALSAFTEGLFRLIDETFQSVQGIYLDRGTSLFETLESVTAEVASRRVSASCACIAAQVEHTAFYLEVLARYAGGEEVKNIDWAAAWQRASVTNDEWEALKARLHAAHETVLAVLRDESTWQNEDAIGGSMAIVVHTAYHLGEIRQALGVLLPQG